MIPVLFLGLVVQGGTFEDMLRAAVETAQKHPGRIRDAFAPQMLPTLAYLALMAGVLGEIFALVALLNRSDTSKTTANLVLGMTIALMVVVAAGPAWRLLKAQGTIDKLEREHPAPVPRHGSGRRPGRG